MIEIDGSYASGGGQILRTACALSVITQKPCRIFNIRKARPRPGLAIQHLLGIQALAQLCSGNLEGDKIGSKEIRFFPGEFYKERLSVKIPTAGSITLVLQTLIPPALFAPKPVEISFEGGATDTFFSPTLDYFRYVFLKVLEKMEGKVEIEIFKRGFYPLGGSKVKVRIFPSKLKPLNLIQRGELQKISIFSLAGEFLKEKKVAERQARKVEEIFEKLKLPIEKKIEYVRSDCPGSALCLVAYFTNSIIGVDNLGRLGKSAESVGEEAALQLLEEEKSQSCLDRHLGDQILPYLALTGKKCQIKVSTLTEHIQSNIWVIEKFFEGNFEIKDNIIFWNPKV